MYSCKKTIQLVSASLDRKLGWGTRMMLWMHLGMCGICFRCRKTAIRIQKEAQLRNHELEQDRGDHTIGLSSSTRERIRHTLDSKDA